VKGKVLNLAKSFSEIFDQNPFRDSLSSILDIFAPKALKAGRM